MIETVLYGIGLGVAIGIGIAGGVAIIYLVELWDDRRIQKKIDDKRGGPF